MPALGGDRAPREHHYDMISSHLIEHLLGLLTQVATSPISLLSPRLRTGKGRGWALHTVPSHLDGQEEPEGVQPIHLIPSGSFPTVYLVLLGGRVPCLMA